MTLLCVSVSDTAFPITLLGGCAPELRVYQIVIRRAAMLSDLARLVCGYPVLVRRHRSRQVCERYPRLPGRPNESGESGRHTRGCKNDAPAGQPTEGLSQG